MIVNFNFYSCFLGVLAKIVADACGSLCTIQRVAENPRGRLVEEWSQNAL